MVKNTHSQKAKTKIGFTLAEVLITLGVIGIVAAITIPGLMTKYHRHVAETKLAKFDSIINQAVRMSIAENDDITYDPPADKIGNGEYLKEWFDEYLMKYVKADYNGDVIQEKYYKADYNGDVIQEKYYKVAFLDGTGFVAYINRNTAMYFFYCLNVRDKSCAPEVYDGKNSFVFSYDSKAKAILPIGYGVSNLNELKYSTNGVIGCYVKNKIGRHYCAQLIKQNGWKIPNDYPWIK